MSKRTPKPRDIERAEATVAGAAEAYPNVTEAGPWGHRAFKIQGKTFLFLSADEEGLSLSVKLPVSGKSALAFSFAEPTHYGLGKSGWVTARFAPGAEIPLPKVIEWVDESFRAIAPKKVVSALADSQAKRPRVATHENTVGRARTRRATRAKTSVTKASVKKTSVTKASVKKTSVTKASVKKPSVEKASRRKPHA